MIFVPLPFVVALLLFTVQIRLLRQEDWRAPEKRPFLLLIGIYALQSVLIGIRWGYDVLAIMPAQVILAAMIAALAWVSFRSLTLEGPLSFAHLWPHTLPAVLIAALLVFWREPMGVALILIFLGYGAALLWLARHGPDGLIASRLDGALLSYRSLLITAAALIAGAVADIYISLDFDRTGGTRGGAIVALGNVITLLVLGGAASIASGGQPAQEQSPETPPTPPPMPTEEDGAVAASLDALMQSREIYRDPELNLNRIARKMSLPARRVSIAVNRIHGVSVSQYVNEFRIRSACDQLIKTDEPVTRVMFDSGFISKSNFNREFLRVTGTSPTDFRRRRVSGMADTADAKSPAFVSR
ncbi:AraC-type DNA-binding protein [Rhizobium mongolense subsp. loessense]|uniref:AraC-type DNA-binding protein n=1 Tax=Rhizobium mongolense subsp. loessense TaxID=158890 RepID=A0A1G4SWK2_9HYPH|nr:helix-turn-helix domain-containing protein [Rhizobium mongolense]SCW73574.1 AraC-type DNA-binding protein [Rhizobium mongolense subsp. loessense]